MLAQYYSMVQHAILSTKSQSSSGAFSIPTYVIKVSDCGIYLTCMFVVNLECRLQLLMWMWYYNASWILVWAHSYPLVCLYWRGREREGGGGSRIWPTGPVWNKVSLSWAVLCRSLNNALGYVPLLRAVNKTEPPYYNRNALYVSLCISICVWVCEYVMCSILMRVQDILSLTKSWVISVKWCPKFLVWLVGMLLSLWTKQEVIK